MDNPSIVVVDDDPLHRTMVLRGIQSSGQPTRVGTSFDLFGVQSSTEKILFVCAAEAMIPDIASVVSGLSSLAPRVGVVIVANEADQNAASWLNAGVLDVIRRPFRAHELGLRVRNAARRQALECQWLTRQDALEALVAEQTEVIRSSREEVSLRLISASRFRDNETGAHVRRIGLYAAVIAEAFEWTLFDVEQIRLAAPMHDIGKVAIPDAVLKKPGALTPEEWSVMRLHTTAGEEILAGSSVPFLNMGARIARSHHEKFAGGGYPDGLIGEQIPLEARITAVVDVYDALRSRRPYKEPWVEADVLALLERERGRHFDPKVVDCFFAHLEAVRRVWDETPDEVLPV